MEQVETPGQLEERNMKSGTKDKAIHCFESAVPLLCSHVLFMVLNFCWLSSGCQA